MYASYTAHIHTRIHTQHYPVVIPKTYSQRSWRVGTGEIIPQAVCSRHGLAVGAYAAWFVRILMWTFAIIAYPISKVLDHLLGQGHTVQLLCPYHNPLPVVIGSACSVMTAAMLIFE